MKKIFLWTVLGLTFAVNVFAEETTVVPTPSVAPEAAQAVEEVQAAVEAVAQPAGQEVVVAAPTVPQTTVPAAVPVVSDTIGPESLEFVSGEITAIDEAGQSVTLKLYGEADSGANDKILTVSIDANTDLTDGEKDRDIKSLTNGTEVDVEYDSKTSKATYIFVY